jgi:hypothetical protein
MSSRIARHPANGGSSGLTKDGRCELEIFTGHDARRQALRYAMRQYEHFREVQLEQQGETPRLP